MEFTFLHILAAFFVIALGTILQASTGLGAGLLVVPLLALIHLELVPGPVMFASLTLSSAMTYAGRRAIKRQHLLSVTFGLLAGMLMGIFSVTRFATSDLGPIFGVLILVAVMLTASGVTLKFTIINTLLAGALSGFMGMTAAIGAPILALLYQQEKGETLRATLAFLYLFSSVGMLALLHAVGRFDWHELWLGVILTPGIVLGYLLSPRLAAFLDRGHSRSAVLIISTVSALVLIAKNLL